MKTFGKTIRQPTTLGKYALMLTALLLVACTTNIKPMDATQTPPSAGFGAFAPVLLKPIANQTPQDFPPAAVARVQSRLQSCLSEVLGPVVPYSDDAMRANPKALVLEPVIRDGKKVSVAARIFFSSFAGSSAVLMQVTYRRARDGSVLAQPVFYAKAAAMSGAWTFGFEDNEMLDRLSDNTCRYTSIYKTAMH